LQPDFPGGLVFRASRLPQTNFKVSEPLEAATPGRRQWIFAVLILAGMILIGVSALLLLRESTPVRAPDACAWVTLFTIQ
jgi:hypothetical protein